MKNITILLIFAVLTSAGCKTSKIAAVKNPSSGEKSTAAVGSDFSDPKTFILGYFKRGQLLNEPYAGWFTKEYEDYSFNTEALNSLLDINKDGLSVKIVMGTWCPDSRREVPRFMKILDLWQFPAENVTFIGVDRSKSPSVPEYPGLNIERVPTFIIYKNKIEAGRIIETPVTSLEQDLVNILKKD